MCNIELFECTLHVQYVGLLICIVFRLSALTPCQHLTVDCNYLVTARIIMTNAKYSPSKRILSNISYWINAVLFKKRIWQSVMDIDARVDQLWLKLNIMPNTMLSAVYIPSSNLPYLSPQAFPTYR